MLYFPIIQTTIPASWPFWAGEEFEFFRPVFNIADAAISIGFVVILLMQNTISKDEELEAAKRENSEQ
jgi:signal peptidase II